MLCVGVFSINHCIMFQLLLKEGAFMEEIQGWERPGWFVPDKIIQVEPYDYYGSYGLQTNENHAYSSILAQEYSFDFPHNYDQVIICLDIIQIVSSISNDYFILD